MKCVFLFARATHIVIALLILRGATCSAASPSSSIYSPADFGAQLDGKTNDRDAFQKTIDAAAASGGGIVVVSAGKTLLTGSIELKAHVHLTLEPGSVILASTQQSDYTNPFLIRAQHAHDVSISGSGLIEGRGTSFMSTEEKYIYTATRWRPGVMLFEDCTHVQISEIQVHDAPEWTIHLAGCNDVLIHGVTIRNSLKVPNCDGIDPDHSRNVRITNCDIECGDDCIVLKTSREFAKYGPTENILVSDCILNTQDCALKIGTETVAPIRNVVFANCVVNLCHRGIGIMLRDAGDVENVIAHDIIIKSQLFFPTEKRVDSEGKTTVINGWWGASEAIYLNAHARNPGTSVGHIHDIVFSHIIAHGEAGVFVQGSAESQIQALTFEDVSVHITKTTPWPSRYDLRPPEQLGVQEADVVIAGFHLKDAKDVTLRNCGVTWGDNPPANYGPALSQENVTNLTLENFAGQDAH